MWHWNSLWAPAPGDPPAIDDPKLWRTPWTPEQAYVVQARTWDTFVSASRAWWSFWLAAMPLPGPVNAGQVAPAPEAQSPPKSRRTRSAAAKRPQRTSAHRGAGAHRR